MMIELTDQQLDIIREFIGGENLVVAARAGCGKTTMALELMWRMEDIPTLVLMFNKRICEEWVEKTAPLKAVVPHTLDSFMYNFYDKSCTNDFEGTMSRLISQDSRPEKRFRFGRLIVDEAQDFNPLTLSFLKKILLDNDNPAPVQFCIFGDVYQCIYQFRNSNNDLLLKTSDVLQSECKPMLLSKTFRCSKEICDVVNRHWKSDLIQPANGNRMSDPDHHQPEAIYSFFINMNDPDDTILRQIASHINEDTVILGGSVQSDFFTTTTFIRQLVRNEMVDIEKICCTTIHKFKGLEADTIILLGHRLDCPNVQYVGMTRAIRKLIFVQDIRFNPTFPRDLVENTYMQNCETPFVITPFQFTANETVIDEVININKVDSSCDLESAKTAMVLQLEYGITGCLKSITTMNEYILNPVSPHKIHELWNIYHNTLGIQNAISLTDFQRKFMEFTENTTENKINLLGQLCLDVYSMNDKFDVSRESIIVRDFLYRFQGAKNWKFFTTYNAHEKYGSDITFTYNHKEHHVFIDLRDTSVSDRRSHRTQPSIWISTFLGKVVYSNFKN